MIDLLGTMIAYLLTISDLTDEVGDRIADRFREEDKTLPAVVVTFAGGEGASEAPQFRASFQIKVYAESSTEAQRVYGILRDELHSVSYASAGSAKVVSSDEEVVGIPITESNSRIEGYMGIWNVWMQ